MHPSIKTRATDEPRMAPRCSVRARHGSSHESGRAASPLVVRGIDLKKGGQRRRTSIRRDPPPTYPCPRMSLETGNSPAAAAGLRDDATAGTDCSRPEIQPIRTRGRYSLDVLRIE